MKYRQDLETGEFIEAHLWEEKFGKPQVRTAQIMLDIKPFVSPIDQSVINSRPQLAAHNKKHGVINIADYSPGYFEKAGKQLAKQARGQTPQDKIDRCKALDKTITYYGG